MARSGASISLCLGPASPPYLTLPSAVLVVLSTWSPKSTRIVKILSVRSRASSTYLSLPSFTLVLPLCCSTWAVPLSNCSVAAFFSASTLAVSGPGMLCSVLTPWTASAGSFGTGAEPAATALLGNSPAPSVTMTAAAVVTAAALLVVFNVVTPSPTEPTLGQGPVNQYERQVDVI